jgi:molybdate transport system substrate-binding protein
MKIRSLVAVASIGFMILLAQGVAAEAAEITLLNLTPLRTALDELGPQFERATGHKLVIKYEQSGVWKRQIEAGETFDVVVLPPALMDDLIKTGKIVAGTRPGIARTGLGVAVKKGAPKPDIKSVDAFKHTLLNAKSIAYPAEGAPGVYFTGLLERLGIASETKSKLKPLGSGAVVQAVVKDQAEIAVVPTPVILAEPGAELVGPLPPELQNWSVLSAGVGTAAKQPHAASALITFLTSPAAIAVMKAKGLEPVTP